MSRRIIRFGVASTVVLAVLFGGIASPVVAQGDCVDGCLEDPTNESPEVNKPTVKSDGPPVDDKVSATRVRKAFLKAKKAFHEARQNIGAIKKGDKGPVENVPTFFGADEDTD